MNAIFDLAVIGGGPAGAAAALTLARAGRRCIIVEGKDAPAWKIGETLAPESRAVLQSLGVWEAFLADGHLASHGAVSCWGGAESVEKDFIFNPHGCGWQLDRARFESRLQAAAQAAGAEILRGLSARALERRGGVWCVHAGEQRVQARWLIDASGRASIVARHLGQRRVALDQLVSIYTVATAPEPGDEDGRTFVEARPGGWWYAALMPGGRRTVSWQTDADLLIGESWREPGWLHRQLQQTRHLGEMLAGHRYSLASAPRLTSAQSARIEPNCGEGWLAVGDAAQSFDPLSGQGIFHALLSGHRAAKAIAAHWPEGDAAPYAGWLNFMWDRFLAGRNAFYQAERRWSAEAFWQRRTSRSDHAATGERLAEPAAEAGRLAVERSASPQPVRAAENLERFSF